MSLEQEQLEELQSIVQLLRTQNDTLRGIAEEQRLELAVARATRDQLNAFFTAWQAANTEPRPAVTGRLTLQGEKMALTVDTTPGSESVSYQFDDDDGNPTSAPTGDGSGIVVALASADGGLTEVGAVTTGADAAGNPLYSAPITVLTKTPGTAVFSAVASNQSGAALTDDDGSTPFTQAPNLSVSITAGDPVSGSLSVSP